MEGYLAQIIMFAGNFAPRGWALCQGQLMSIAQNTALFALLGTTYGGDGQTTFGLPDLRGRASVGTGQGSGLTNILLGELAGQPTTTLTSQQIPQHNHTLGAVADVANTANPTGNSLAVGQSGTDTVSMYRNSNPTVAARAQSVTNAGGSQPHNNMQPYLGMNFVICLEGIFPSQN